jgi:hypothetical protein
MGRHSSIDLRNVNRQNATTETGLSRQVESGAVAVAKSQKTEPFTYLPSDPLAAAHRVVDEWIETAVSPLPTYSFYEQIDLKKNPQGQAILDAGSEGARTYVMAAVAQVRHWDRLCEEIKAQAESAIQRANAHHLPGWDLLWVRRRHAEAIVSTLMRRTLPFQKEDLLALLGWCCEGNAISTFHFPIGAISRALQRYAAKTPPDDALREAMTLLASRLRGSHDKDAKRHATAIEQLCAGGAEESPEESPSEVIPPPKAVAAGAADVHRQLKKWLGLLTDDDRGTTEVGPDRFPLLDDSPLQVEHELLSSHLSEVVGTPHYHEPDLQRFESGRALQERKPAELARALLAASERHINAMLGGQTDYTVPELWQSRHATGGVVGALAERLVKLDRDAAFDWLLYVSARPSHENAAFDSASKGVAMIEQCASKSPLTEGERYVLWRLRASRISGPPLGNPSDETVRLTRLIGDGACFLLAPGEAWSDAVNIDAGGMQAAARRGWTNLFTHALTATAGRPTAKWLKAAQAAIDSLGSETVQRGLERWFPLVNGGQSVRRFGAYVGDARGAADTMNEENATILRGLLWMVPLLPDAGHLLRGVTAVALSAYRKVPGVGPRAVKVGNAAVYALSEVPTTEAVGQLAMLKVRVKFGTAQKEIEKAFNAAAEALALPRDQIEEMGVPSYGLEPGGVRRETLGDYSAELLVTGSDARLSWHDAKGKLLKSVPARVKADHKDDLKDLQQSLKDIQGMLPAQRDRIDGMFLLQKNWAIDGWRARYLDHPLIGSIARRLLWCVDGTPALFVDGVPTDVEGRAIAHGATAEITLWHPVGRPVDEITAWRRRLEQLAITQPFKQAHREVYLLTDAERRTNTYSNRYAAHVVRQHQFNALCAARGWKNRLRLMVDDSYPPATRDLPLWGLRAEFWIEGAGTDYGTDTTDSGAFLRLTTDQVRFYRTEASTNYAHAGGGGYESQAAGPGQGNINEPLPLENVPPLVLSEVLRDVDLFVGVASVGNDPTWQDGGPEGRYREYWHTYSFGELSGTAATRKQVLERLIPRLKIASRCSFNDRFLVVQGQKRTYKIHLGSGNILMEPNDQYLCIVPDSRARAKEDGLYLPFEGDSTLSIILSKALLLADDTKIKDPTITRQIDGR